MRYKVNGKAEEFDCPMCGAPVYNGDRAWQDEDGCFCSAYCAGYDPRPNRTDPAAALVGTVWQSSAGNTWRVVANLGDGRVRVQHATENHTHVWHHSSVTGADMTRVHELS